jgi:hypothetical protein
MRYKPLILSLLFFSSPILACFNDSGCPQGNICVKTGYLIGTCLSQAGLYGTTPPYYGNTVATPVAPSGSSVPVIPVITPRPITGGTCTNNINCASGFVCSRPNGVFTGICTQLAP